MSDELPAYSRQVHPSKQPRSLWTQSGTEVTCIVPPLAQILFFVVKRSRRMQLVLQKHRE